MSNRYIDKGYKNKEDYLIKTSLDYNVDKEVVETLSEVLRENEDFDGLLNSLEEY